MRKNIEEMNKLPSHVTEHALYFEDNAEVIGFFLFWFFDQMLHVR